MTRILVALVALVALAGCGGPSADQIQATVAAGVSGTQTALTAVAESDPCSDADLASYTDALEELLDRYDAQLDVTGSTPRASLGGPLQRLVDYEDEARDLTPPECLVEFDGAVLTMMQRYREGYQTFAAQGPQQTIDQALAAGDQIMAQLRGAIPSIREGALPGPITIPQ